MVCSGAATHPWSGPAKTTGPTGLSSGVVTPGAGLQLRPALPEKNGCVSEQRARFLLWVLCTIDDAAMVIVVHARDERGEGDRWRGVMRGGAWKFE
jgi:hypothetical protein